MQKVFGKRMVLFILSFMIPVIVMLVIMKNRGFYPFGDKTLFIMDMRDQYMEFFASLRYLFRGDDSIFFSWSRSMGGNYLGLFAYYVASPLSFLTLLFPLEKMALAILFLTVLKVGLCGLSFAWYASYLWAMRTQDDKDMGSVMPVLIFSVSYALISYNMVYSMCLMWLDGVILLPLILLGAEKILSGQKSLHYTLALAALFICNYYTAYMVGIFTALYMLYRVGSEAECTNVKEYIKKLIRFTGATFLAFGIAAPLLLPVVKDLMQGKLAAASYMPDADTNFAFMELFGKLKNGVYDSITNEGLPAIYCGYLVSILLVVFFVLRGISLRRKISAACILILMACSFYFVKLDIAWHGFLYPTWFPYRYAFLASFFMIHVAFCTMCELWVSYKNKKQFMTVCTALVLTILVSIDLGINADALFRGLEQEFGYSLQQDFVNFLEKEQALIEEMEKEDDGFYRTNVGFEYSKNDAMLLGYHGLTHYSSTFHAAVNSLTSKLGMAQAHIWNSGYGTTALLDSLFAVQYVVEDAPVPASYLKLASGEQGAVLYKNPLALPIAYSAPLTEENPNLDTGNPFENQNHFLNALAGTDTSYFTSVECTAAQLDNGWSYTYTADTDNPCYLYMHPDGYAWADVYVNDAWVGNYFSTETTCSLYLGNFTPGEQVTVHIVPNGAVNVDFAIIAQLHMETLSPVLQQLQQNGMKVTTHKDGKLCGTVQVEKGHKIVTSIPYDSGWTVRVDGKKVQTEKFADTFVAVSAEEGEHTLSFSYVSPGFGTGMVFFTMAVLIMLCCTFKEGIKRRLKRQAKAQKGKGNTKLDQNHKK